MRIIVSGGGTGGHIYPALTLIHAIEKKVPGAEFLYVGTKEGLEADIVPKEGIPFATVPIQGFRRSFTPENLLRCLKAVGGVIKASEIVRKFRPDAAIGTGGYVCGPILLAASLAGTPSLIQEQNVVAGITNKILSRFVSRVAVGMEEALKKFPAEKTVFTGNPIRDDVIIAKREDGLKTFGLDPAKKTVLVSGGSRGARSINRAMAEAHKKFAGDSRIQILHVTGRAEYEATATAIKDAGIDIESSGNIFVLPYLYNMPLALAAADIAVFRAGAIGLAELSARGVPSILVPYPYAAENHQEYNARSFEHVGAARVIHDSELTGEKLTSELEGLLSDHDSLARMAEASRQLGHPCAADEIADIVISIANK